MIELNEVLRNAFVHVLAHKICHSSQSRLTTTVAAETIVRSGQAVRRLQEFKQRFLIARSNVRAQSRWSKRGDDARLQIFPFYSAEDDQNMAPFLWYNCTIEKSLQQTASGWQRVRR